MFFSSMPADDTAWVADWQEQEQENKHQIWALDEEILLEKYSLSPYNHKLQYISLRLDVKQSRA